MQISNCKLLQWLKLCCNRVLFTCKHADVCFFPPLSFHFQLGSFWSPCCQQMSFWRRQRKWEGAGYHQHRNEPPLDAPSKAQPQRRLQPLHYLFNLQMTVSPNAILPSIKSRGSWIYKRQSGDWLPPAALLGPIIQAQLSPVSLHFLFQCKGYSPSKPRA